MKFAPYALFEDRIVATAQLIPEAGTRNKAICGKPQYFLEA
jgi:hypothetical protein